MRTNRPLSIYSIWTSLSIFSAVYRVPQMFPTSKINLIKQVLFLSAVKEVEEQESFGTKNLKYFYRESTKCFPQAKAKKKI